VKGGGVREVILATNPDAEGDATSLLLERMLLSTGIPVSRLARGLASGASIEFAGTEMLADALEHRRRGGPARSGSAP
jgi:recombination protein RecR